ncbi:hypothetical protein Syun_025608 [Stephania yunnanensis]|uniref:NPH3 domain-containing protein n=1 Tax=Stephania yunnanensis TaxID=152371 RepID=A0AAP0HRE8_9MAGN
MKPASGAGGADGGPAAAMDHSGGLWLGSAAQHGNTARRPAVAERQTASSAAAGSGANQQATATTGRRGRGNAAAMARRLLITMLQETFGKGRKKIDPKQEHEKRVVLETIVSLLPREKNTMSVSFLFMLLRDNCSGDNCSNIEQFLSLSLRYAVVVPSEITIS